MSAGIEERIIEAWIASYGDAAAAKRNYEYAVRLYNEFLIGERLPFFAATARDLDRFGEMLVRERRGSGAAYVFGLVRLFYRWAHEERMVPDIGNMARLRIPRNPEKKRVLESEDALRVLAAARDACSRDAAMLSLLIRGAQKPRDVIGAHMRCFYGHDGIYEFKTSAGDWIRVSAACGEDVAAYIEATGRTGRYCNAPIFLSESNKSNGDGISLRGLNHIVNKVLKSAGMNGTASCYDLGSAAFDLALSEGEPAEVLQCISDRDYAARMRRKETEDPSWL